ncbi:metallophosphoesterase [Desulfosporosinus fructosivorans]|uniref:Metallophosphoesterase n=1 Tax=Desulfosporosinus fructosivorans TaxID=2018669 RepID=A0A4Z0R9D1_9FIRM|nr:metallophosphoesterase [Desulfosporosinus fructosivorans]TGE38879.1 metallophosphoesterase [Desulfosporosinus fructosivorans]
MGAKFLSRRAFILGGIATLSYLCFDIHSIAVKRYTIAISKLPTEFQGFTILHLTDLHSKDYGDAQKHLIELINRQQFDAVAITGDLVDKSNSIMEPAIALVKGLQSKPVFFVPGNHEWWTNYQIKSPLEDHGVHILENRHFKYHIGSSHIWIMGVDDPYLGRDKLNMALADVTDSMPKVLLAHAPNIFSKAVEANADLVLVGHTHGGQVRLPLIGAVVAPGEGLFPEFDYGQFTSGSTNMIINGGLGESVLPIRFYNRPEIVLVTLVSSS